MIPCTDPLFPRVLATTTSSGQLLEVGRWLNHQMPNHIRLTSRGVPFAKLTSQHCLRSGDVKIWDLRSRSGAAAITLTNGSTHILNSLVLASANPGSGAADGGLGSTLGAGMMCFAGGAGEAIWAWDLRGGQARCVYEMSTGNTIVESLVWHQGSNSLIAACDSPWENRHGDCSEDDFIHLGEEGEARIGRGDGSDGEDSQEESDDMEGYYWPISAFHSYKDFGRYSMRYRQSDKMYSRLEMFQPGS